MKPFRSLRLRITLLCALLLTLCCAALAVTSNLSAIHLTDTIAAAPLSPALDPEAAAKGTMPLLTTQAAPVVQQAQQLFQIQSILASTVILATGLLLIYLLVGRALAPLKDLNDQIQGRTAKDLDQPLSIPDRGDEVTQLAHSFDDLSQRLSRAFLMQRSFSQNAAHEFRTPLAVLKTRIGLFRKKQDFAPQTTEAFLSIMESEVDRLSGMVDSLLKLTNLEQVPRSDRTQIGRTAPPSCRGCFPSGLQKGHRHFGGSLPWHDHRQQRAAPPGTVQSGGKCGQIRAGWRTDTALCGVEWSRYCHHRGQSGTLYPAGVTGADLRALLSGGYRPLPGTGGCRPGAGPGPGHCRNPRRQRMGGGKSGWLESIFGPASGSMFMRENHHSLLCY